MRLPSTSFTNHPHPEHSTLLQVAPIRPSRPPPQQEQYQAASQPPQKPQVASPVRSPTGGGNNNNYHRPAGQNVGNFMTDRSSSRVLAPPGGSSQITFG